MHPGAVAAARRARLPLEPTPPRHLSEVAPADLTVTVCDRAHEELAVEDSWWHWSIADPAEAGTKRAFDAALAQLDARIRTVLEETAA